MKLKFDTRHFRWWWQRRTRGFDDRELWSLNYTILKFTLPRLKAFQQARNVGFPSSLLYGKGRVGEDYKAYDALPFAMKRRREDAASKEWQEIQRKMVRAVESWVESDGTIMPNSKEEKDFDEGMDLFFKYFFDLWD